MVAALPLQSQHLNSVLLFTTNNWNICLPAVFWSFKTKSQVGPNENCVALCMSLIRTTHTPWKWDTHMLTHTVHTTRTPTVVVHLKFTRFSQQGEVRGFQYYLSLNKWKINRHIIIYYNYHHIMVYKNV